MTVELRNGDTLEITCIFTHEGKAFSGAQLYAAIGKKGLISFDEVWGHIATSPTLSFPDDPIPAEYSEKLLITIKAGTGWAAIKPGTGYELYVKLVGIPGSDLYWYGPLDDITIVEPEVPGEAVFSNLEVTYKPV